MTLDAPRPAIAAVVALILACLAMAVFTPLCGCKRPAQGRLRQAARDHHAGRRGRRHGLVHPVPLLLERVRHRRHHLHELDGPLRGQRCRRRGALPVDRHRVGRAVPRPLRPIRPNLVRHDDGYPTADELRAVYKIGNITNVGEMTQVTEGSEWIKKVILDGDDRPLYIQAWGGNNTTARALKSIQERYQGTRAWPRIVEKINRKVVFKEHPHPGHDARRLHPSQLAGDQDHRQPASVLVLRVSVAVRHGAAPPDRPEGALDGGEPARRTGPMAGVPDVPRRQADPRRR